MSTINNEKKGAEVVETENASNENDSLKRIATGRLDAAGKFLDDNRHLNIEDVDVSKIRHKVDRTVIPLLCACFIMQFLDKAIYNYTALMGIKEDLHFGPGDFSNIASAYAVAHLVMQIPNTYFLQRFPASKWLCTCVMGWGIVTLATAAVKDARGMLIARVFLAIAEATIGPSLMLITAQWYTKSEQAPRFAFWHSAPGVGQIFGGLLSFAFQHVPKDYPIQSWRLMFIALGVITLIVGCCCFYWLPDTPMNAKFLNNREKVAILKHVSVNMTGVSNRKIRPKELLEAAMDVQIYGLVLVVTAAAMTHGLTGTYSTSLIKGMGFTGKQSALLNMPTGVVGIAVNLLVGFGIRRTSQRWAWGVVVCIPGIIGAGLLAFLHQPNLPGALTGLYMVVAINSVSTICQQWAVSNVSGHTKRALIAGAMTGGVGVAGILSPQTFQEKDREGGYIPAKVTVLCTQAFCAVCFFGLFQYYYWTNVRRNKRSHQHGVSEEVASDTELTTEDAWGGLTDKQNWRVFRYVY